MTRPHHSRRRRAYTLVEVLVALAVGSVVMGAAFLIFYSSGKMGFYGELAGTLQEGALAMSYLQRDLTQAVRSPSFAGAPGGGTLTGSVYVTENSFQLIRSSLGDEGRVEGQVIVYQKRPTQGGNYRLRRHEITTNKSKMIPGIFKDVKFTPYSRSALMRVTFLLSVLDREREEEGSPRTPQDAVLSSMIRVKGAPEVGAGGDQSFVEGLADLRFLSQSAVEAL